MPFQLCGQQSQQKINLVGLQDWSLEDQKEVWDLILEYAIIFVCMIWTLENVLPGEYIRFMDDTLFKEHYRHIPPSMYQEVHNYFREIYEIGAIQPSHSLWPSLTVLVWKKDGKPKFSIDLWKVKAMTVKDLNSLLRIEDNLDSLNGAVWFAELDFKSGCW